MRLAHLALLFFAFSLPLYMMGYTSPLGQLLEKQGDAPMSYKTILTDLAGKMVNPEFALPVIGIAIAAAVLSGFSAVYIIPALIIGVIFNYVLIPTSFILESQCLGGGCLPGEITTILQIFFNLIVILAFAEFITGR